LVGIAEHEDIKKHPRDKATTGIRIIYRLLLAAEEISGQWEESKLEAAL
jgi:hypothetical protein